MRKHTKENIKSYQNRKLTLKRIRELQSGIRKDYKSHFMAKRNSYWFLFIIILQSQTK